jgi:stress response protein YsnF
MAKKAGDIVVPVIREEAHASAVPVKTGTVRVTKSRETHEELLEQELRKGRAEVKRVPVNRVVDGPQPPHRSGETLVIPVVSEVLNGCEKQWVITEEIHVTRTETAETVQQKVELATERAHVERLDEHGRVIATDAGESTGQNSILNRAKRVSEAQPKKVLSSSQSILRKRLRKTD